MPELPEVETVVKALDKELRGEKFTGARSISRLRLPLDESAAKILAGREIVKVRRRAKYLIFVCDGDAALLAHLGMTGFFHVEETGAPLLKHDRAAFPLANGRELRFSDARRFGFVKATRLSSPDADPEELAHLGPEPLAKNFSGVSLFEKAKGRKAPVKVFIMDQEVVVGVGNIYASEALFASRISPERPASSVSLDEFECLSDEIKAILRDAIKKGGSSIKSYRQVDGSLGKFQLSLKVYGRGGQACGQCGGVVKSIRQGGRSTFFCPVCQK